MAGGGTYFISGIINTPPTPPTGYLDFTTSLLAGSGAVNVSAFNSNSGLKGSGFGAITYDPTSDYACAWNVSTARFIIHNLTLTQS
jgi:hypothetical protein